MNITEIPCLWDKLASTQNPILLYGMGDGADKIINALKGYGKSISGVFCSDELYREKTFHSFKVMKYSTAKEIFKDMTVLMSFGTSLDSVIAYAQSIAKDNIFYVPDVPVFGDGLFNTEFFKSHQSGLEGVYERLCDSHSKAAFEAIVNFKLSGKPGYLYPIQTDSNEAYSNILHLGGNESFLDLGAYDGDTVSEFISHVGSYKNITALEPDRKNFKKLEKNTKDIDNITLINAAAGIKSEHLPFNCRGGRSSTLSNTGKDMVETISVDSLESDFSFIKIDVEGNEINTIKGAAKTIARCKPKMIISAYHKNEDLFSIPELVLSINPDYKVYLRHYKYLPAWDTNFYFV